MPYSEAFKTANPELVKSRQRAARERFIAAHPDYPGYISNAKARWYDKNKERERARNAEWKRQNPDKEFNTYLRRRYGITREQYDEMLRIQNGKCGICKGSPVGKTRSGRPHDKFDVDHDHLTNEVRGLLCHPCNVMLGQARDRVDVLIAAISWLSKGEEHAS